MNILKDMYVIENLSNINITKVTKEVDMMLGRNMTSSTMSQILKSPITIPVFRLYLLNEDESIRLDASSDFIHGELSVSYQTGQRSSLNVTLVNQNNKWTPKPITGLVWIGSKFRLDTGIVVNDTVYWKRRGVFVVRQPEYKRDSSNQTISFSMCDKFGLFNGNVSGRSAFKTIIPEGTDMEQAFYTVLTTEKRGGKVYDSKKIIFAERYKGVKVFYDIEQDYNGNMGDILIELGRSISCDVFYNEYGNLVVQSGVDDYASNSLPVVYRFIEGERDIISASLQENWEKMRNYITVNGATVDGHQFTATVLNKNIKSPFNVFSCDESPEEIEDTQIHSDELCMDRAMYEIIQRSRGVRALTLNCPYIPHIDVNQMILVEAPSLNVELDTYIVDEITMNISSDPKTTIVSTNVREVSF